MVVAAVRHVVERAVHRGSSSWEGFVRAESLAFGPDNPRADEDHSTFFEFTRRGHGWWRNDDNRTDVRGARNRDTTLEGEEARGARPRHGELVDGRVLRGVRRGRLGLTRWAVRGTQRSTLRVGAPSSDRTRRLRRTRGTSDIGLSWIFAPVSKRGAYSYRAVYSQSRRGRLWRTHTLATMPSRRPVSHLEPP